MTDDIKILKLGDENYFKLIRGMRITKKQIHANPGDIPIISGHKEINSYLGYISEKWLKEHNIPIYDKPLITINSNGNVGKVFLRENPKYTFHDDVTCIKIENKDIEPKFLVYAIRESLAKANFKYGAKLYIKRLENIEINIPVTRDDKFDVNRQIKLMSKFERLELLKDKIVKFSNFFDNHFITLDITAKKTKFISLGDRRYFKLIRGKRVRKKDIHNNPGNIPVISSSQNIYGYLGMASENWLRKNNSIIFDKPMITVNADGSVGDVFLRSEPKYTMIDVVIGIEIMDTNLNQTYMMYAIKEAIAKAQFSYGAKLYTKRLESLDVVIPITEDGKFDIEQQNYEALKYERLEEIEKAIKNFSNEMENKFILV